VRIYTRYQLPRHTANWRTALYWLLSLAGLAFLGWIFFASGRQAPGPLAARRLPPAARAAIPATRPAAAPGGTVRPPASSLPPVGPIPPPTVFEPRPVQNWLEAQVALARLGLSCGSLDGVGGNQTRTALRVFQRQAGVPATGVLDATTRARLRLDAPLLVFYTVTTDDVARLLPLSPNWLGKSQQARLDYETVLELVAEKAWSNPALIRQLNPQVNWESALPGLVVRLPNVAPPPHRTRLACLRISLAGRTLEAFDDAANVLLHAPCSIARNVAKRPVGELHVVAVVPNPTYTFDPAIFPESPEARQLGRRLLLPAGPNNPVGTAWIGLDRPGYGIHGTPRPEDVGHTESHGCFRLANWNAEYLAHMVSGGTPVFVEP
jgi:lipoprotein-anchoring transpeptidase ErfK/SrfK